MVNDCSFTRYAEVDRRSTLEAEVEVFILSSRANLPNASAEYMKNEGVDDVRSTGSSYHPLIGGGANLSYYRKKAASRSILGYILRIPWTNMSYMLKHSIEH
jgi:hypothetical protein